MTKLLINENPLQVLPTLATKIGLNQAIVLQQMHYWLDRSSNIHDGKKWVYNSVREWNEQFPFWNEKTISRILKDLCDNGLLIKANYNKSKFDKTWWYTINYEKLEKLEKSTNLPIRTNCPNRKGHNDIIEDDKSTEPIPENTREYHRLLFRE